MRVTRTVVFIGGTIVFIVLVAVLCAVFIKGEDKGPTNSVEVTIKNGTLSGEWRDGLQGRGFKFASFQGIPYALPPIGDLRFRGPKPPLPWTGVRQAKKAPTQCIQNEGEGSEDCLYLNVYTPKLPTAQNQPNLAVYVYIFGGAFQHGSSGLDRYGPDFLTAQDIIVVTMNYRTGIMASLSLDTEAVPGNAGLKDELQALRWVNENIAHFGGDPSKVTLGGQSSGGVSSSWLSILPQTKGLIRSAITQSGSAVASWSYTDKHIEFAKEIYKHITGKATDDLSEIARLVKSAKYLDLHYAAENATLVLQSTKSIGSDITFFYTPYIERRAQGEEEKLITKDPESYILSKEANDVPLIIGETKDEWTMFFSMSKMFDNEVLLDEGVKNLKTYVPPTIYPGPDSKKILGIDSSFSPPSEDSIVKQIQDYYFFKNPETTCNTNCKMTKFMHQVYIMVDTTHMVRLRSKYMTSPTYGYVFNLRSDYSTLTGNYPSYLLKDVVHGADTNYVWSGRGLKQDYYGNGTASMAVRRQVTMLANFIKHGDPTPETTDEINIRWKPVQPGGAETYLEITETLTQRDESMAGKGTTDLWSNIFLQCRDGKSP